MLSRDQLLEIDYYLRLTRTLEERLVALFRQAKVIGGLYRSLGQEGESVAAAYALDYKQGDVVQPLIRNLGSILVAGAKPVDVIKQYMAKGDSPTRGRAISHGRPASSLRRTLSRTPVATFAISIVLGNRCNIL